LKNDQRNKIPKYVKSIYPNFYCGGAEDLAIEWVNQGTQFSIEEYDGYESIIFNHDACWEVA